MRPNRLQQLFAENRTAIGGWCAIANAFSAEVMSHCGYDTVIVDLQHGTQYLDAAVPMLQAISTTDAVPMARCSANNFFEINKLLDAGAYGIICPMIDTADDARAFVSACRYPPTGTRSFGPTRGFLYGGPDYHLRANDTILTWAMIETPQGLANLDEICAVEGLDGVFVGPSDLSLALGVSPLPNWNAPPLSDALARILSAAHRAGRKAGIFCISTAFGADMKKAGFDFVVHSNDAGILREAAQRAVAELKG